MSKYVEIAKKQIYSAILESLKGAAERGELPENPVPEFSIEIPPEAKFGDFSVNAALVFARPLGENPRKIAEKLVAGLDRENSYIERAEIAGPGFINLFLKPSYYSDIIGDVLERGFEYGRSDFGGGKRVLVEFVSANPTGPMHIGNARGGALGDGLSSVLEWAGFDVTKEFYINDAGNQIEKFGLSLEVRYLQIFKGEEEFPMPEDAYHGEDITIHARSFAEIHGDKFVECESAKRRAALVDYALPVNIKALETDLLKYRIKYDSWFRESTLHETGAVDRIIEFVKERGFTYEEEGALWFKATEFGCDKDYVLVRSNGIPTYIVPDIAYHYDKLVTRGYDRAINVLGADHHGYTMRLKPAVEAVGVDGERLEFVLTQMVRLMRGKEIIKASKRTGKSITLTTLLDEVPIDAARFYFNMREANVHFDFDLDLAVAQTSSNPVYYVQYAHARICSIIRGIAEEGAEVLENIDYNLLVAPAERALIRLLADFTGEIVTAAKNLDPSRLTKYSVELAAEFHRFYSACRVRIDDRELMSARLGLCKAAATVLKNVLGLLKIEAPERM